MSTVRTDSRLPWGHRYLMVEPDHFRVDYSINPFMHLDDQPDPRRTRQQWLAIVAAIEAAGGIVEVLPQLPAAPDMVYAMNLGLAFERPKAPRAGVTPCSRTCATPNGGWRPQPPPTGSRSGGAPSSGSDRVASAPTSRRATHSRGVAS